MVRSRSIIATPPGATIKEQLNDRGMSQKEFAVRIDMSEKHVSKLINGEVQLTPEVAVRLEIVLGVPARFWNNLEAIYREKLIKIAAEKAMDADENLARQFPYSEMAKLAHLGARRSASRASITASASTPACHESSTTLRNRSVMIFLLKIGDHPPQLVCLLRRQSAPAHERVEKAGQTAAEIPFHKGAALRPLHLVAGHQRRYHGVLRLHHAPLRQALDDSIGGGFLPPQLLRAQVRQLAAAHRLMLPQDLAEPQLAVKDLRCLHPHLLLSAGLFS